ncbi:RidA family protein [Devosia sp. 63-57]|uniref:RidA family protein n=1 Tax=Devosia sp. 63-57 TaxID=1895751 RepID=UPI00086BE381|nr:RidA family protein [Devosia sp. 63-57]ODT51011.1 MAG: reactive intermediate/imine deaminase [Pelagibacterium sp. SCN 63-126]ODU84577.1 MAG: reactive intermediate/imine deaminase [Pelagibacterium sp. SCN 63-17]OJX44330.1 MAG: reactive intermediate/imine deaminase [Devosia sp. 63-57]
MLKLVDSGARSHLPFSPAFIAGDLMFVSGQASVDSASGAIITDTFEGEMRRSIENLRAILEAGGLSLDHVVNVKSYVADEADLALYNQIYPEYFSEPRPSRSTIVGVLGTKLKFELDCVAYARATRQQAERIG